MTDTTDLLEEGRRLARLFYAFQEEGRCPMAHVRLEDGEVKAVRVQVGNMELFFHATIIDGQPIEPEKSGNSWAVPFDGWGAGSGACSLPDEEQPSE